MLPYTPAATPPAWLTAAYPEVLNADKDHCTEEAEAQTGQVAKVQIEATGVEFLN